MISTKIIKELETNIPYILDAYGGINNFIVYTKEFLDIPIESSRRALSTSKYQELINYFYTLFNYRNNLLMISPWAMYIDLRDILLDQLTIDSINPDLPYQIYDYRGNLKYSVVGHLGIFGESRLDENLVNKSMNGSLYFLKYKTYSGSEVIKLIIINLFSREIRTSNTNFQSPTININSTITLVKTTSNPINTYFVSSPPSLPNLINIDNFRRPQTLNILSLNNPVNLSINQGGWLLIDHNGATFQRSNITNISNDIIIQVASDNNFVLYYVGLNIDVSILNQYFNQSLTFSNKPITEIITII